MTLKASKYIAEMGERGMADMGEMEMPLPDNTLPMMTGAEPEVTRPAVAPTVTAPEAGLSARKPKPRSGQH